jgi:HK97 gp10 family phage protein
MAIIQDIREQKVRLVKATFYSKIGRRITNEILIPILDQLEKDVPIVLEEAANWARKRIVDILSSNTPSGRTYRIFEYTTGDFKNRTPHEEYDPHTASAENEMPAKLTGTLAASISYEIHSDGYFRIGVLKEEGEFSDAGTELESAFYSPSKHTIYMNSEGGFTTPVGTYAKYLAEGTQYMAPRPFLERCMDEIREDLRKRIRKNIRRSLNKSTGRVYVRKAIVFKVYFT